MRISKDISGNKLVQHESNIRGNIQKEEEKTQLRLLSEDQINKDDQ